MNFSPSPITSNRQIIKPSNSSVKEIHDSFSDILIKVVEEKDKKYKYSLPKSPNFQLNLRQT
jgi:hypothetical protein